MKSLSVRLGLILVGVLIFGHAEVMAGEIYRWVDKNGTVYFSDSPPPYGSFKKEKIEDEADQTIRQKQDLEKKTDIDDREKFEQKMRLEEDYQKKAKKIRDYDDMRRELRALDEKYQAKMDEFDRQLRRATSTADIYRDREQVRREYYKEIRRIKEHYGYY